MKSISREFFMCIDNNNRTFFPGDTIKGFLKLDLKKSTDIQCISLSFKGVEEIVGERVVLIDETVILASPNIGQKYTVLNKGQTYTFDFEFKVPKDLSLPSYTSIPNANISYFLIATPKQRFMRFTNNLPEIEEEIKIYDFIDISLPDYRKQINMNHDLGFVNGNKIAQWNVSVSNSAFVRGNSIQFDCNIYNFPPMKKSEAIKVSLVRQVYKTGSSKVIEKRALITKVVDLNLIETSSTKALSIILYIPDNVGVSVFPTIGRIISVSYSVRAELNMKGVKTAIKLKDSYTQEAPIVIGTCTNGQYHTDKRLSIGSDKTRHSTITMSNVSLSTPLHQNMSNTSLLAPVYQNMSSISLTKKIPTPNFHEGIVDSSEIKPLERLDKGMHQTTYKKSYLPARNSMPLTDDNIYKNNTAPKNTRASYSVPHTKDRSLTPLPSIKVNSSQILSYSGSQSSRQRHASAHIITSPPHEIGPNDVITRAGSNNLREDSFSDRKNLLNHHQDDEKALNYDDEKALFDDEKVLNDEEKGDLDDDDDDDKKTTIYINEKEELIQVPSLTRHDTVSTTSSVECSESRQYPYSPKSYLNRNKRSQVT